MHSRDPSAGRLGDNPVGPRQEDLKFKAGLSNLLRPFSLDGEINNEPKIAYE